ncbi:hypothetical protein D3C86_1545530 [compost metagenome]
MPFPEKGGAVTSLAQFRSISDGRVGQSCMVIGNAIQVIITPVEHRRTAGRAQGIDHKCIPKPHALAGEAVEVGRREPREPGLIALLFLDHAQRIETLVVGVDENDVGPGLTRSGHRFFLLRNGETACQEQEVGKKCFHQFSGAIGSGK